jgi:hypothetical protein
VTPLPSPTPRASKRYILAPFVVAATVWLTAVMVCLVLMPRTGFVPVPVMIALAILGVAAVTSVVSLAYTLVRRRWRSAMSIALAMLLFAIAAVPTLGFRDEVRWLVLRPLYASQLAPGGVGDGRPPRIIWDEGLGTEVALERHASDADAQARYGELRGLLNGCRQTLKKLAPGYYLFGYVC